MQRIIPAKLISSEEEYDKERYVEMLIFQQLPHLLKSKKCWQADIELPLIDVPMCVDPN